MKRILWIGMLLGILASPPLFSHPGNKSALPLLPGVISQIGMYSVVGSSPWWGEQHDDTFLLESLLYGTAAAAPIGLYRTRAAAAGGIHLMQAAAAAAGAINHLYWEQEYLGSSLVNLAVKGGMYSGYLAYTDAIGGHDPSLARLSSSPVRELSSPFVWGSIAAFSILGAVDGFSGDGVPLWESRKVQFPGQDQSYSRIVGIPLYTLGESVNMLITGIGEEAYYRGFVYRELKEQLGPARGKALNAVLFPLVHLPQEIAMIQDGEMSVSGAITGFALRSGITLLLDSAYEAGGLELSTAVHTWINLALHLARFVTGGGAAPE